MVYCREGTRGTFLLSWTVTSLRAGASGCGQGRRGLLGQLLEIGQIRHHLGELLLLLSGQLLEIGQARCHLGEEGLPSRRSTVTAATSLSCLL